MTRTIAMLAALCALALSAPAQEAEPDDGGTLNPPEMGIDRVLQNIREGHTDMVTCASGYYITKKGDHADARDVFGACAEDGWTRAMTWMGQMENNGLGGDYDPDAAAEWDRRSAEAGDTVGKFNHGLNLLRGHGVPRDEAAGRALIDEAAAEGLDSAQRLKAAGYDPEEVTPDADRWRYGPLF